jgi:hypothetical protein
VFTQSLNIIQANFSPQKFNSFKDNLIKLPIFRVLNRRVNVNIERTGKEETVICFTFLSQVSSEETEGNQEIPQ